MRAALVFLATAAGAQDVPAVGRITYGDTFSPGGAICTGTLVAPDLVLTAGHCVIGNVDTPAMVRFAAGYADGVSVATGRGAAITMAAGEGWAADAAVVRLEAPLALPPLPTGPETDPWLTRVGYRRDSPETPETNPLCLRVHEDGPFLQLMCGAVSGNSGAPLLSRGQDGNWRVAAVVVATFPGGLGSFAIRIPPDLAKLLPAAE